MSLRKLVRKFTVKAAQIRPFIIIITTIHLDGPASLCMAFGILNMVRLAQKDLGTKVFFLAISS